jgi:hypothetical protein
MNSIGLQFTEASHIEADDLDGDEAAESDATPAKPR